jgi:hypothetical protein
MVAGSLRFFEVKETSWELAFIFFVPWRGSLFVALRSNDFHDYVNWLIIGTFGELFFGG